VSAAPTAQLNALVSVWSTLDVYHGGLAVTTTGLLRLVNSGNTTQFTGGTNVCDGNWHWIEWGFADNTGGTGYQQCWADGVVQWSGGTANLQAGPANYLTLVSGATQTWTIDDFFYYDGGVGQAPQWANQPLGPRQIDVGRPASDSLIQFAPDSGGVNFSRVNEVAADEDASYVQSATSGQADEYTLGALGFTPVTITSIQHVIRAKNPGAGSVSYKHRCHSGATTSDGSAIVTPSSYQNSRRILDQDPNTGAAWTGANLANAKIGQTVV